MDVLAIISTIFATLFGGLNIFQWLTFRSYKRLKAAEADRSDIENLRTIIQENQAEIGRLAQRIASADQRAIAQDNRYSELERKYDALKTEFEEYKQTHK